MADSQEPHASPVQRQQLLERARLVRQTSDALQDASAVCDARRRETLAACLETATRAHDCMPTPARFARLVRLCGLVGRSPEIEQAKEVLATQMGIQRTEAWEVLRRLSQRTNRKLRDVAHEIVVRTDDQAVTAHAHRPDCEQRRVV
jgi:ANTAR domain